MQSVEKGISLSPRAAEELWRFFERYRVAEGSCVRVWSHGGACSCSSGLEVADEPEHGDLVFESEGLTIVCDRKSYQFLAGSVVDYDGEGRKGGYVFRGRSECGSCRRCKK
jgi:iron-sulfur cluster assembly protein